MIDFVICDDDNSVVSQVVNVVLEVMMKNNFEYSIKEFNDYDEQFINYISTNNRCSIYILDIQTNSGSGIDVARLIRSNDVNSIIIFLTGHEELGQVVLKKELLFLSFINKFENSMERLKTSILEALRILKSKRTLRFEEKSVVYTISMEDILYVTRDSIDRKSVIKTNNNIFKTYKSLAEIKRMLDGTFYLSHRSCLINVDRVDKIDKHNHLIIFDNGESIDMLSDKYKKELLKVCA